MSFTIRELESLSGVKAHTIRIWEQRYHFLKPSRTQTNIRTYSNEELKTLLTVALLNKYGYKISRIDQMRAEERTQTLLGLPQTDAAREVLVNELISHMIDMDSTAFEERLNAHIRSAGVEHTITEIIFSFLEKVGILWQTNKIVPVQEHIVSNIIRQKIVSAIEVLPLPARKTPVFLLFLPEDEHHEMGLLFVYYLLRKSGIPVLYLGANVPLKDVAFLVDVKKPEYLYMHLTSFPRQHNFLRFLQQLTEKTGDAQVLISGSPAAGQGKPLPPRIQAFQSFGQVVSYISSL